MHMGRMGGTLAYSQLPLGKHDTNLTDAFIGKAGSQIAPFRWIVIAAVGYAESQKVKRPPRQG